MRAFNTPSIWLAKKECQKRASQDTHYTCNTDSDFVQTEFTVAFQLFVQCCMLAQQLNASKAGVMRCVCTLMSIFTLHRIVVIHEVSTNNS
ncbi:hypothetical protein T4D_6545 [Trichinella pseudospiralis]|uniref:Uncharacterized protein n=1 Tax=Trichinella pseudospiralis TaxID=6337 RepID=A0A0V1FUT7_TRIPS|nr:hypothetical protein T4D_6545 [Trichinella pseudospiralis]